MQQSAVAATAKPNSFDTATATTGASHAPTKTQTGFRNAEQPRPRRSFVAESWTECDA